ncbi:MAG: DUF2752 domain-containing protein [Opitutaceae bacterium]|nr:DUF2752 domain-containing protein [Opitutaceae bacterium]
MPTERSASAPPPLIARVSARRRLAVLTGVLALIGGVVVVHLLGARPPAWYPPCWFHRATGLHCPGCGTGRAVHALAQGDLALACDQNLLAVAMLPVLAGWAAVVARRMWRGAAFSASLPGGWAGVVLVAVVVFTLLRNLPWWPFLLLAPE